MVTGRGQLWACQANVERERWTWECSRLSDRACSQKKGSCEWRLSWIFSCHFEPGACGIWYNSTEIQTVRVWVCGEPKFTLQSHSQRSLPWPEYCSEYLWLQPYSGCVGYLPAHPLAWGWDGRRDAGDNLVAERPTCPPLSHAFRFQSKHLLAGYFGPDIENQHESCSVWNEGREERCLPGAGLWEKGLWRCDDNQEVGNPRLWPGEHSKWVPGDLHSAQETR